MSPYGVTLNVVGRGTTVFVIPVSEAVEKFMAERPGRVSRHNVEYVSTLHGYTETASSRSFVFVKDRLHLAEAKDMAEWLKKELHIDDKIHTKAPPDYADGDFKIEHPAAKMALLDSLRVVIDEWRDVC